MSDHTITYYDFTDLQYISYFLAGFIENQQSLGYDFNVERRMPEFLRSPDFEGRERGINLSIALFQVDTGDKKDLFCIDSHDSHIGIGPGKGYHVPLLDKVKYYFKVNYNRDSIDRIPELRPYRNKIMPAPPFLPIRPPGAYRFYPHLHSNPVMNWNWKRRARRIKDLRRMMPLSNFRSLRDNEQSLDIFFVVHYYPEEIHASFNEFRYKIIRGLSQRDDLNVIVGFASKEPLPGKYEQLRVDPYTFHDYFQNFARTRLGIYVRGVHDCLSFKLGQLLAMGKPIIGQTLYNNKEELYRYSHFAEQFAFNNPVRIVEEAADLLYDPMRLQELGQSNAHVFDSHLDPTHTTADMLHRVLSKQTTNDHVETRNRRILMGMNTH